MNPERPKFDPEKKDDRPITDVDEQTLFELEIERHKIERLMEGGERAAILHLAKEELDREIALWRQLVEGSPEPAEARGLGKQIIKQIDRAEKIRDEYTNFVANLESEKLTKILARPHSADFAERLHKHCDLFYGKDWLPIGYAVMLFRAVGKKEEIKPFIRDEFLDNADFLTEYGLTTDQAEEVVAWLKETK